jgi:glyoxylase-like metal-dependent hydrolase (beta-lactamase superfamily II)
VSVSVRPRPAELPLLGGSDGATVTVYPLLCGEQLAPPAWFERPSGTTALLRSLADRSRRIWVPLQSFLVVHPTAGPLLVDTGLHPSAAERPTENLGPVMGRMAPLRFRPEQTVRRQLADHGVQPADLAAVVMTHLHFDHASGIPDLPEPTYLVGRREWDAAVSGGWRGGYVHRHIDQPLDWRTVDFGAGRAAAHGAFAATFDLFGDGSVRLLFTPGHSLGHMSLLLRLRERELMLCGDAIYTLASVSEDVVPLLAADRDLYARSREQIGRHLDQAPETVVVPGHDPQAWTALDAVYS